MEKSVTKITRRVKPSAESTRLIRAAKNAARNAIRTSKALGLDITYLNKGTIYKETADGEVIILGKNQKVSPKKITLKKGTVLNAKA